MKQISLVEGTYIFESEWLYSVKLIQWKLYMWVCLIMCILLNIMQKLLPKALSKWLAIEDMR